MFEPLLLLLVNRMQVQLQFRALVEPQQQLGIFNQDSALSRRCVLSLQKDLLVKLDLRGYLGLILIAWGKLEGMLLTAQDYLVLGISFLLLIDVQSQVFSGYLMPEVDRLLVLNRRTELHIVALRLNKEESVLEVQLRCFGQRYFIL